MEKIVYRASRSGLLKLDLWCGTVRRGGRAVKKKNEGKKVSLGRSNMNSFDKRDQVVFLVHTWIGIETMSLG